MMTLTLDPCSLGDMVAIYALTDPRDDKVYYVGQSSDPAKRLTQHIRRSTNDETRAWIDDLLSVGREPKMTVLLYCDAAQAREFEQFCIERFGSVDVLLNRKVGPDPFFGDEPVRPVTISITPAQRKHLSEIGGKNVSEGVRRLLQWHEGLIDKP